MSAAAVLTFPALAASAFHDPLPAVPPELKDCPQWVLWAWGNRDDENGSRDGKRTKVPISAVFDGRASSTDRSHWADYITAALEREAHPGSGLGFVFATDDPYTGIDLDHCVDRETGAIALWARAIIDQLASYSEISPSGTGVKIWIRAKMSGPGRRTKISSGEIEVYSRARYFTVTGNQLPGVAAEIGARQEQLDEILSTLFPPQSEQKALCGGVALVPGREGAPLSPEDGSLMASGDEALIRRAKSAANGAKFRKLWEGGIADYKSPSEADMALCSILGYWADGDEATVGRLFRQSGLYREKWDSGRGSQTYGQGTVGRACAAYAERRATAAEASQGFPSLAP